MTLIVHHLQVSQSERIVWLAEELGLDYKLVLHKRDPFLSPQSIKDLNPLGQAPVIQDGDVTLAESSAIAEYCALEIECSLCVERAILIRRVAKCCSLTAGSSSALATVGVPDH